MTASIPRESNGHAHLARCVRALLLAAGLTAPLAWPHPAHGGATAQPEALYHLAQCNDGTPAQLTQWDCTKFDFENPLCGSQVVTAIRSSQVLASLKGRLTVRVDDATCSGDPTQQTRLSLRVKPSTGADFSLLDRDLNFCGGVPLCGGCASEAGCCDNSCSIDCDPFVIPTVASRVPPAPPRLGAARSTRYSSAPSGTRRGTSVRCRASTRSGPNSTCGSTPTSSFPPAWRRRSRLSSPPCRRAPSRSSSPPTRSHRGL